MFVKTVVICALVLVLATLTGCSEDVPNPGGALLAPAPVVGSGKENTDRIAGATYTVGIETREGVGVGKSCAMTGEWSKARENAKDKAAEKILEGWKSALIADYRDDGRISFDGHSLGFVGEGDSLTDEEVLERFGEWLRSQHGYDRFDGFSVCRDSWVDLDSWVEGGCRVVKGRLEATVIARFYNY